MTSIIHKILSTILVLGLSGVALFAQTTVPELINYQGYLVQGQITGEGNTPLGSPSAINRTVVFRLWSHPTETDPDYRLYGESQTVTINNGSFSVLLGQGGDTGESYPYDSLSDVFSGSDIFLGITVDDGDGNLSNDVEISPRQQIVSTAYALRASVAGSAEIADTVVAGSIDASKIASNSITGDRIRNGTITSSDLASNSVGSGQIINGSITESDLAHNSVGVNQIKPNSVGFSELQYDSVTESIIVNGTISYSDLDNYLKEGIDRAYDSYLGFNFSDLRLKESITSTDSIEDLETLMQLSIRNYQFRDESFKAFGAEKKLIAQELEIVFPQAVYESTGFISDILQNAQIDGDWILLATDLKVGEVVGVRSDRFIQGVEVLEVRSDRFRVPPLREGLENVFVIGRQVDDLRSVDYNEVAMLNLSATQEIKRELDAQTDQLFEENALLREQVRELEERLNSVESVLKTLLPQSDTN